MVQFRFRVVHQTNEHPSRVLFCFGMIRTYRQELRVGAILREQNALPYEAWTTANPLAKDDVNNVGAGRAAKGAFLDARSSLFRRFAPYDRTKIGYLCEMSV